MVNMRQEGDGDGSSCGGSQCGTLPPCLPASSGKRENREAECRCKRKKGNRDLEIFSEDIPVVVENQNRSRGDEKPASRKYFCGDGAAASLAR